MDNKYYRKLVGQRVYLSPLTVEDAQYFTEWLNDFSITMHLNQIGSVITLEKEKELLQKLANRYCFAILDKETNKLLGSIGFDKVDLINGTAEFGIFIGDKNFWNRGYGTEASMLMLDYGFNVLNLHHIHLEVLGYNKRAMKAYEKVGFKQVGKLSEVRLICGERIDMIIMEILAKDFQSNFIRKAFDYVKQEKAGMDLTFKD